MEWIERFQGVAERSLLSVLEAHQALYSPFHTGGGKPPVRYANFKHKGEEYEIVISDNIVMTTGNQLFECYLREELGDDEVLISSFAKRLDRFLTEGSWD
jgi:hypothetical protein